MLSYGLDVARSGLNASGDQAAVVARNVANAGNPLASRKIANAVTAPGGGVIVSSITRASSDALTKSLLAASSSASGQQVIAAALNQLESTVNDPELGTSPAAMLGKLSQALQVYASSPDSAAVAASAIDTAKRVATSLHDASDSIQTVRRQADADLAKSVATINSLLSKFETVNREIVKGSREGADITDQLDARDELVRQLADEVGVRTINRASNDMAIFTDSGLTLFDVSARKVSMEASPTLAPGTNGNPVYIDGVPVTGSGAPMATFRGRISGLADVRDKYCVVYQRQMDEIARGLVETFAEKDQSAIPTLPDIVGLFSYAGAPTIPPTGVAVDGLSRSISVAASVDPVMGGDHRLLRDGSIGDPGNAAYTYNPTGAAGFSGRLQVLISNLSVERAFDPASGLGSPDDLQSAGATSSGWLEDSRQKATAEAEYRSTLVERSRDALSRATGVNLDEEMTTLLDIERAYQTSTKILTTIDSMFSALLNAI